MRRKREMRTRVRVVRRRATRRMRKRTRMMKMIEDMEGDDYKDDDEREETKSRKVYTC